MERRKWVGRLAAWAAAATLALAAAVALAGTTGKLSGRVTNQKKEPLTGVNVIVVGMPLGATTDDEGRFSILNIPSGRIAIKASLIGHTPVSMQNIEINADITTRADLVLNETAVAMEEIVVSATRPVIETNRTSNIATVSREKLATLPVQELQDVVNLQAGVVDGHFRGGRIGEVQYQVDGVTVNNSYDNKSGLKLDRSLLEEVQVISGTFDAEYGQAMSGVVNAVLKRGGDKVHWDAEVFTGGAVYGDAADRIVESPMTLLSQTSFQGSVSGPLPLPKTTALLSLRYAPYDDWIRGEERFSPADRPDTVKSVVTGKDSLVTLAPTGSGEELALGFTTEWSGVLKLSNRSLRNVSLDWQGILNVAESRRSTWAYHLVPGGLKHQRTVSLVQGADLTHTLSPTRFYTLSARQNYTDYEDFAFEDLWDPRYDAYGPPRSFNEDYEYGALVQGVDLDRFVQHTNGVVLKGAFVDQVTRERQTKVGAEFQAPHIEFGSPGYLQFYTDSTTGASGIQRREEYSPEFPGVVEYRPFIGAAFAQQEVEWNDLTMRLGLRYEYFDARSTVPSDFANPANSIEGVPQSEPQPTTVKGTLAPRIGVSYPISPSASLFFAYGHFYQLPPMGDIFRNADYAQLSDLQASSDDLPIMGNPDIRPERTVQYQFGYKHAINEFLGLDVTTFYKDIRDLLGTTIVETYNGAQYAQLSNVDFGSVVGITVAVTRRTRGAFSATLDYTWQSGQGNSSDPYETANRAAAGEDARPQSIPFDWDQRHTLNLTAVMARPDRYSLSGILRFASGQPYTPSLTTGFSGSLETNSGRKPTSLLLDLRGERPVAMGKSRARVFARIFNVFDTRFFNGFVFPSSGDPYYSRFPGKDEATLNDPTRYYGPRRLEVGLTLNVAN